MSKASRCLANTCVLEAGSVETIARPVANKPALVLPPQGAARLHPETAHDRSRVMVLAFLHPVVYGCVVRLSSMLLPSACDNFLKDSGFLEVHCCCCFRSLHDLIFFQQKHKPVKDSSPPLLLLRVRPASRMRTVCKHVLRAACMLAARRTRTKSKDGEERVAGSSGSSSSRLRSRA